MLTCINMGMYLPQNEGAHPIMGNPEIGFSLFNLFTAQKNSVGQPYSPDYDIQRNNIPNQTELVDPDYFNKVITESQQADALADQQYHETLDYMRRENEKVISPTKDALRAKLKLSNERLMTDEYDAQYNASTPSNIDPLTEEVTRSGLGNRDEVGDVGLAIDKLENELDKREGYKNDHVKREGYVGGKNSSCGCSGNYTWLYIAIIVLVIAYVLYRYKFKK